MVHLHEYRWRETDKHDREHEKDADGAPVRLWEPEPDEGVEDGRHKEEEDGGGVVSQESLIAQQQGEPEVDDEFGDHEADVEEQRDAAVDHHLGAEMEKSSQWWSGPRWKSEVRIPILCKCLGSIAHFVTKVFFISFLRNPQYI